MIWRLRSLLLSMLLLAFASGTVTMAVARSHAAAAFAGTTLEICSGTGVVSVTLDASGNPTGPVHPCPECLAGLAAFAPPSQPGLARPQESVRQLRPTPPAILQSRSAPRFFHARAPPRLA